MADTKMNLLIAVVGGLLIAGLIYAGIQYDSAPIQDGDTVKLGAVTFQKNLSYVLERAQSENKMIFIYGMSEICGWCEKFEAESLSDERIVHLLDEHFIILSVDTVKQRSLAVNLGIRNTPTSIFTTSDGQEIPGARIPGYMDQESFYLHLNGLINKGE